MTYLSKNNTGFSLIELMVVMAIMAVVMSLTGGLMQRNISQQERHVELENVQQLFKKLSYNAYYQGAEQRVRLEENQFVLYQKKLPQDHLMTGLDDQSQENYPLQSDLTREDLLQESNESSEFVITQVISFKHLVFVAQDFQITTKGVIFPTNFGIQSASNIQQFALSSVF